MANRIQGKHLFCDRVGLGEGPEVETKKKKKKKVSDKEGDRVELKSAENRARFSLNWSRGGERKHVMPPRKKGKRWGTPSPMSLKRKKKELAIRFSGGRGGKGQANLLSHKGEARGKRGLEPKRGGTKPTIVCKKEKKKSDPVFTTGKNRNVLK